jgi:hypothetical protein
MCGLSNISFGMPERQLLNQTLMAMAMAKAAHWNEGLAFTPITQTQTPYPS